MKALLRKELEHLTDPFTTEFAKEHGVVSKKQALYWIHFPSSREHLEAAKKRIKFEGFSSFSSRSSETNCEIKVPLKATLLQKLVKPS